MHATVSTCDSSVGPIKKRIILFFPHCFWLEIIDYNASYINFLLLPTETKFFWLFPFFYCTFCHFNLSFFNHEIIYIVFYFFCIRCIIYICCIFLCTCSCSHCLLYSSQKTLWSALYCLSCSLHSNCNLKNLSTN